MTTTLYKKTPTGGKGLAAPYAKLPHDIAADPRLLAIDVRLLLAIVYHARANATCWPSDTTLGGRIARSRATVQRRLRHLEGLGLIARERTDANPTGRLIRVLWVNREAPPVSPAARPPAPPVRHELGSPEKDPSAPPVGDKWPGPPPRPKVMTPAEAREHYRAAGWLDRPESDPLRRLAERRLVAALGGPGGLVPPVAAGTSLRRPKRPGGLAGPRQPFVM